MTSEGRLAGEVAIVTGAAHNIGAAVARRLGAEGAAVAVNHRRPEDEGNSAAIVADLERIGARALAVRADVSDEDAVHAMVARVTASLGAPTILVNNAATAVAGDAGWTGITGEEFDRVLRVNLTGAFLCARAVHQGMRARGWGRIVSMGSVRSLLGRPGNVHYTASKSALEGMGRVLARELGPDGITVNTVVVGAIRTSAEATYGDPEALDRELLSLQAVKRRGEPQDVAAVVAFIVSRDAEFITGQSIVVDGGWVMA